VLPAQRCVGEGFVVSLVSPGPLRLGPSAKVSRSPHSHPKEVGLKDDTESGLSSTTLCPHSSHTRMPPLEGPFTTCSPPCRAALTNVVCPEGHHNVNLTDAAALSIMGSERTRPPQP
jgi:hypothetical protein